MSVKLPGESKALITYRPGKREGRFSDLLAFAQDLGFGEWITYARQIHSCKITRSDAPGFAGECDGLITGEPGVVLAIQVADCVPVFLGAPTVPAIGLVHAGWRGTAEGIVRNAVLQMSDEFGVDPTLISCFLGPSIGSCCYKVGADVAGEFDQTFLIESDPLGYTLDLSGANEAQLLTEGIAGKNVKTDKRCTCCCEDGLHSYRRDGDRAGRNICFLKLGGK